MYVLILGIFSVSWVNDRWLLLTPSEVLTCWTSDMLPVVVRGVLRVSCMMASFASKSARAFYSLGTCTNSNTTKVSFRIWTYSRYVAIWESLSWYSPVTCPLTNRESLFASKLSHPSLWLAAFQQSRPHTPLGYYWPWIQTVGLAQSITHLVFPGCLKLKRVASMHCFGEKV